MIYQVLMGGGGFAGGGGTAPSNTAWTALRQVKELGSPDPRRWPGVHRDFAEVFKRRLFSYKECGALPECGRSINVYGAGPAGEALGRSTYILAFRGGLLQFVEGFS